MENLLLNSCTPSPQKPIAGSAYGIAYIVEYCFFVVLCGVFFFFFFNSICVSISSYNRRYNLIKIKSEIYLHAWMRRIASVYSCERAQGARHWYNNARMRHLQRERTTSFAFDIKAWYIKTSITAICLFISVIVCNVFGFKHSNILTKFTICFLEVN